MLDDLDPTTTARGDRLEDPECARVAGTLLLEEIIVLRQQVAHRGKEVVPRKLGSQPIDVAPKQVFAA